MADTVNLPGIGSTKKTTVYAVSAGAILLVAVVYYRSKKQAAAAQAASVAQAGTNEIDPATGYPYGSPEDAAALSTQASYYQATGAGYGSGGGGSAGTGTGTGFVSNAAWAQAYEEYAVNNTQANATTVAAALGKYLTGQPLNQDQLSIVEQAIAFEGLPPIAGTNGYPPSYHLQQSTPSGGGGLPVLKTGIEIHVPYDIPANGIVAVARKFGISPQHIMSLSENAGKNPNGGSGAYYIPYLTQPTDTLTIVAEKFGISEQHLAMYVPAS